MKEVDKLSTITCEILGRVLTLKKCIKDGMMVGDNSILDGVIIFEESIKKLNPKEINDDVVLKIENYINYMVTNEENKNQKINTYLHYGLHRCYFILETYNRVTKIKRLELKKTYKYQ